MPDADRVLYLTTRDDRSPDLGVSFLDFSDWQAGARTSNDWSRSGPNRSSCPATGARRPRCPGRSSLTRRSPSSALNRCSAAISQQRRRPWCARGPHPWREHLGIALCTRPRSARPLDHRQRHAGRRGRSHARSFRFPLERSDLAPAVTGPRPPTAGARRANAARHRPRPGRRPALASRAELETITLQIASEHAATNKQVRARVVPINEQYSEPHTPGLARVHRRRYPRRLDLVRQRRQPDARPLAEPVARNCRAHRAWRKPDARHPPTLHRGATLAALGGASAWRSPSPVCDCSAPAFPPGNFPTGSSIRQTRGWSRRSSRSPPRRSCCLHYSRRSKGPSPI